MITLRFLAELTGVAAMLPGLVSGDEPAPKSGLVIKTPNAAVSQLIERMREKLPPGWTVKLNERSLIRVERTEPALVYGEVVSLPSAPADKASWPSSSEAIGFWMLVKSFPSQAVMDHMAAWDAPAKQKNW